MQIPVIFEDDQLLVLDKPSGLVVDPSTSVKQKTLAEILSSDFKIKLFRGGIVHRLDKETSGLILVAKTQSSLENLQAQFKQRKIKKEYIALVHGTIKDVGRMEATIGRNPLNREKFTVLEEGKEAVTEYEPISNFQFVFQTASGGTNSNFHSIFNDLNRIQIRKLEKMKYNSFTLLKVLPKTGRTHQIRVHLKYIGHPVVSDEKYAGRKMVRYDKRWVHRLFLHAKRIGFYHPTSGKWMELESELPEDLKEALNKLKVNG